MKIKKFDSINVVPFIDIMLVLLVIVLATATFVAKGMIPLDLAHSTTPHRLKENKELTISLTKDGRIFFDKEEILKADIEKKLKNFKQTTPINLSCDKELKFDSFIFLLDILKNNQFGNISIITKVY